MASASEEFIIKLTQQVSGPAGAAEGALAKLEAQIRREKDALGGLEEKLDSARGKFQQTVVGGGSEYAIEKQRAAVEKLSSALEHRNKVLGQLEGSRGMAGQLDEKLIGKKAAIKDILGGELGNMASAATAAGGPIGALSNKIQSLASIAGKAGAAGALFVVAAALIAIAGAAIYAIVSFAKFGAETADAARSVRLLNEAAAGGTVAGGELAQVVADIANRVPLAAAKIAEMARGLEMAKLEGRQMQLVLQSMATLAATVGDGAAGKIQAIAESSRAARRFLLGARDVYGEFASLSGTGIKSADVYAALAASMKISLAQAKALLVSGKVSVQQGLEALDAAVQAKFGKTLAAQMISLRTQFEKLRENLGKLFEGVDLEPFLRGLKMVTDMFAQNTVTGRTMKLLMEKLLQPLLDGASTVFPILRAFMQGLLIGTLLVVLAVLKVKKAFNDAFGGDTKSNIDWVKVAMYAGIGLVGAFTAAVVVLTAAIIVLAIATAPLWLPFLLMTALVIAAVVGLMTTFGMIGDFIGSIDLGAAATNIVNSFINGIKGMMGEVAAAMKALGNAGVEAFHLSWLIKSPSRVAMAAAKNVTGTFADTTEEGQSEVRAAFGGVVNAGKLGAGKGASGSLGEVHFHHHGNKEDFPDFEERAEEWFFKLVHRLNGEGPAPSGA